MPQSPQRRPLVQSISLEHFQNTQTKYFTRTLEANKEEERPTLLGPLERANLNDWSNEYGGEGESYSVGSLRKT
jgi:hypothetical protein